MQGMTDLIIRIALVVLAATSAFGQSTEAVLHFTTTAAPQGRQEVTNSVRSIAAIQQASVDNSAGTLTVQGTAAQIAIAQWVFRELDQPGAPAPHEYDVPGGVDDVVRVFYLSTPANPQAMRQIVSAIRSVSDMQRVVVCNGPKAIVIRGTSSQIASAVWLVNDLEQTSGPGIHAFPATTPNAGIVTIHLANPSGGQVMQDLVSNLQILADVKRAIAVNLPQTVVMRGDSGQIAAAEWAVTQLDQKVVPPGPHELTVTATRDEVARVFYLSNVATDQSLVDLVNHVRKSAMLQRVVAYPALHAVSVRGSAAQVAQSEQIITAAGQPR
jgi:hypothetical protein